jgi:hypothetical protein
MSFTRLVKEREASRADEEEGERERIEFAFDFPLLGGALDDGSWKPVPARAIWQVLCMGGRCCVSSNAVLLPLARHTCAELIAEVRFSALDEPKEFADNPGETMLHSSIKLLTRFLHFSNSIRYQQCSRRRW